MDVERTEVEEEASSYAEVGIAGDVEVVELT